MNRDHQWGGFDSAAYVAANYQSLRQADRWIAGALLETWTKIAHRVGDEVQAIELGTGPNLYPALVALPYVQSLTLIEYAETNRHYLAAQQQELDPTWERWIQFLESLAPVTHSGPDLRVALATRTKVRGGDILRLPRAITDVGQMFFCAESITNDSEEFSHACRRLLDSVRPGGDVIATFMEGSTGYATAGRDYPAVPIHESHVQAALGDLCEIERLERIPGGDELRGGATQMLFLSGRRIV